MRIRCDKPSFRGGKPIGMGKPAILSPVAALTMLLRMGEKESPLVMLVDDLHDARDMYATHLRSAGFRVVEATDGEHALLKVIALMPDVVVMDLAMPVLDGWEATHRLKTHPRTRHIAIVALTGHDTPRDLRRAEHAGADVVLLKPCAPDALEVVIDRLLDQRYGVLAEATAR
jgi:two-component system, cell cycle response regulator DivK